MNALSEGGLERIKQQAVLLALSSVARTDNLRDAEGGWTEMITARQNNLAPLNVEHNLALMAAQRRGQAESNNALKYALGLVTDRAQLRLGPLGWAERRDQQKFAEAGF